MRETHMRHARPRTALVALIAVVVVLLGITPIAKAADDLSSTATISDSEAVYDSSSYTTQPDEITDCPLGSSGGRTGWTRFDAPVNGTLSVTVTTDYDAVVHVYSASSAASPAIGDLQDEGCTDDVHGSGTEVGSGQITRGRSVYIQTLGVCASPCVVPDDQAEAGVTTVHLTFTPNDRDGDGVPDTLDSCPANAGTAANFGCPVHTHPPSGSPAGDRDRDGVRDLADACVDEPGDLPTGCPSVLNGDVRGRWQVNRLLTKLIALVVRAPLGSHIDVHCAARGHVCPFRHRIVSTTTRPTTNLTGYFGRGRILPSNTSIIVRVTHARQIGIYHHLITRRGLRLPKVSRACINSNGKLQACKE